MNNKYGVIAGTPIDTLFGKKFLESISANKVLDYAISKTPDEQNLLQINNPEKLYDICLTKSLEFKNQGVSKVIIYCNSLSSSINVKQLRETTKIDIITPLDIYASIAKKYNNILIIAANTIGALVPEKIIKNEDPTIKTTTIGFLSLVNQIESLNAPESIYKNLALDSILDFSEKIKINLILLACTHFPYISKILRENTKVEVIDLDQGLKELLM